LLKNLFERGRTCREIADEIGVSRNAVIGKLSRLKLFRGRGRGGRHFEPRSKPGERRPAPRQHRILMVLRAAPEPRLHVLEEEMPADRGQCCSLLELSNEKCRWPLGSASPASIRFCGGKPVDGLPYCAGHARMAYRVAAR
jgi:GcrA cell cycle regulator